jgi:hypothetical protein
LFLRETLLVLNLLFLTDRHRFSCFVEAVTQRILIEFLPLFCFEPIELSLGVALGDDVIGPFALLHALAEVVHIVIPAVLSRPQRRLQLRVAMQVSKESVLILGHLIILLLTTAVVGEVVLVLLPLLGDPRSHGKVRLALFLKPVETAPIHISLERLPAELIIVLLRDRPSLRPSLSPSRGLHTLVALPVASRGSLEGLPIVAEIVIIGSLATVYTLEVQIPQVHLVRKGRSPALIRRGIVA